MTTRQFDAAEVEFRNACALSPDLPDLRVLHAYALREQNRRATSVDRPEPIAALASALERIAPRLATVARHV